MPLILPPREPARPGAAVHVGDGHKLEAIRLGAVPPACSEREDKLLSAETERGRVRIERVGRVPHRHVRVPHAHEPRVRDPEQVHETEILGGCGRIWQCHSGQRRHHRQQRGDHHDSHPPGRRNPVRSAGPAIGPATDHRRSHTVSLLSFRRMLQSQPCRAH